MKKICIKKTYLLLSLIIFVLIGFFSVAKSLTSKNITYNAKAETIQSNLNKTGNYIIGCQSEKISNWPFIVSIYRNTRLVFDFRSENYFIYNNHICGGTLIADDWILTAAHCFYDDQGKVNKDNIKVAIGYTDLLNDKKDTITKKINKDNIFIHGAYIKTESFNYNDIALLKLDSKVTNYSKALLPIKNDYKNSVGYILGWGYKSKDPTSPDYKISPTLCGAGVVFSNLNNITKRLMSNSVNAAYYGDSGGPLVTDNQYLSGIISQALLGKDNTTYYVDVYQYKDWISQTTGIKF